MQILLANPRGFCAGVDRAIAIVKKALGLFGAPVYVRHEVVHNKYVVDSLHADGAIFVEELDEVPDGAIVIFSAHGVSKKVREEAAARGLRVFDAICPLVTKVHMEVDRYQQEGRECILIGHAGHPEVEGTLGQYRRAGDADNTDGMYLVESTEDVARLRIRQPDFLAYVTQTTLSMDDTAEIIKALRKRFPAIVGPKKNDICYATQNRQDAVKRLARDCDLILVVGSQNSSNSTRLMEISQKMEVPAYLVDNATEIQEAWLKDITMVGITAGASAPEVLVDEVIKKLQARNVETRFQEVPGILEKVVFSLPRDLVELQPEIPETRSRPLEQPRKEAG